MSVQIYKLENELTNTSAYNYMSLQLSELTNIWTYIEEFSKRNLFKITWIRIFPCVYVYRA